MVAMVRGWRGALAVVGLALFGCGGSVGEATPSCLAVHPCGGDLVGTWRFVAACTADTGTLTAVAGAHCPGTTVSSSDLTVSGSITFNADLTYVARGWKSGSNQTWTSPESCLGGSCAEHNFSISLDYGGFSNESCSGSGGVCACDASGLGVITETGTYTASGFGFHLDGPTGGRGTTQYCVKEPFLHVIAEDVTSVDPPGELIVVLDEVAIRQ